MKRVILLILCTAFQLASQTENGRVFEFGFEQRVRNENWNNLFDYNDNLDDQRVQIRWRTRAWLKAPVSRNVDVFVGLNQETNQVLTPDRPFQFDEAFVESAYVDVKKLFVKGLTLRVGRQNINRGEGFLLLEGTPGDGSRSIYYNAAVLGYSWRKSRLEAIGIANPRTDRYFPRVHDRSKPLQDWSERAIGTYYTDANLKNTSVEAYYFYKKEIGDLRPVTHPQYQGDRHISTAGGRIVEKLPKGWSLTGELALQWGAQHPNLTVSGRGGYAYAKKTFGAKGRHYLLGGYIGMSGDDPATATRIENWDPLFARWPKWSEMLIYSQFREHGPSYWTNTGMWQAETGYALASSVNLRLTYYRVHAYHPFPGAPVTFGSGTSRGHMPQVRLDYSPNKYWKTHVVYERLAPGSFYSMRSPSYFLRFEAIFTYTASIRDGGAH